MKRLFCSVVVALVLVSPGVALSDQLIGTYDINYRFNAAGNFPTGGAGDGNPYYNITPPGPHFVNADPGRYRVVVVGYGADGPSVAMIWSGDAGSGTRRNTPIPGNIGDSIEFDHSFGQIAFYYWDWFAGDNQTTISTKVELWKVVETDTTAPEITITSPATGSYLLNETVFADFGCTDSGTGVSSCVGSVAVGQPIDTSSAGTKSFTVTATDNAGNTSTKTITYTVGFGKVALYDQSKAKQSGSTYPIKLQLSDAFGANVSSLSITVHAVSTTQLSGTPTGLLDDSGSANPDYDFRYDSALGGYIFNLSLKGYGPGIYLLHLRADNDPTDHTVQFQVR